MCNLSNKQRIIGIGLFLLALVLVRQPMAQECRGPNLNLTITDMKGDVTNLTCAYFGDDSKDFISCKTESRNDLNVKLNRIRKISIIRNQQEKVISLSGISPSYFLATIELKEGEIRDIYIRDEYIVGNSSWGRQTFYYPNIQMVEFE